MEADRLAVEDWRSKQFRVGGLPDAAINRAKIKSSGVARHAGHGDNPAATEWPNETPFQSVHEFRRNGLGYRRGFCRRDREQDEKERHAAIVEARP